VRSTRAGGSLSRGRGSGHSAAGAAAELKATASSYPSLKQILAWVDGSDRDRAVLDQALQVALRYASHIDVLHVRLDARGAAAGNDAVLQLDSLLGIPVERAAAEAATRARMHFEEWHGQNGLPLRDIAAASHEPSTRWREIVGFENEVVARLGRLSDLIVMPRPRERSSSSSLIALESALFDTCRPVLMVPQGAPRSLLHHPLIAWNGSLEAARAVGFALPFLSESRSVVGVFIAPEAKHRTDPDELLYYLGWHGIVAERFSLDDQRPAGARLLAQAEANGSGLIVMGAYTHGHYRQFLFGGVTRHVMDHAAVPILLAH
jgi:nucleotide-binding universal stress UspA family protein